MTRPEAIAALRERLAEVQRCTNKFAAVLPQTNQPGPLAFFPSVLERIRLILENEHEGATGNLAAALVEVRKDIRRHPLPDLDSDLDERTWALFLLRGERGNLIEALENAREACQALSMPLRANPEGALELPREAVREGMLRALDERLRRLDTAVTRIEEAAAKADTDAAAAVANHSVNQNGLINLSVRELKVDIAAARFEAKSASDPGAPPTIDLAALAHTLEAIRDTARGLSELVQTLQAWVAPAVAAAGRKIADGAERAWRGLKTLVRMVRHEYAPPPAPTVSLTDLKIFQPPLEPLTRWRQPIPGLAEDAWPDMITLPAGEFTMGSPPIDLDSQEDERPQRLVTIKHPFSLGRTAVTFAMWDAAIAAGFVPPSLPRTPGDMGWGRGARPVINVSWYDAQAYCAWLNDRLKLRMGTWRLPSEAEWEYGCRAGTVTPFSFGTLLLPGRANFSVKSKHGRRGLLDIVPPGTVEVGKLPANSWGLHEMHGNVWEWVADEFGHYPSQQTDSLPLLNSGGKGGGVLRGPNSWRAVRGGSWSSSPEAIRSASRGGNNPFVFFNDIGFRLARSLP
jgi:formylglycine-generating enzyme required for sulfatase activity